MLSQCEYLIPKIMDPCFLQLATEQENGHPEKNESSCTTTTDIIYNCLVGQIFVRQNATTCLSLRQEHSLADRVFMLQPQPSGTRFHHSSAHHQLLVDSLELG